MNLGEEQRKGLRVKTIPEKTQMIMLFKDAQKKAVAEVCTCECMLAHVCLHFILFIAIQ